MLEQLRRRLADTDCHDTFLQLRIKQKRKNCTRGTCIDVNGGIHGDLEASEDSLIKEIACVVMFTKCNSEEKQLQHLNHISRSHVDYYIVLLMNHPLYLLCWVVLLISFISCPWFFFLFSMSCFTCLSSCRFYQTVSNKEGQGSSAWTPLGALNALRESCQGY